MSEADIQKAIVRTLRICLPHGWLVQATANKPRSMIAGAIEKTMGTVAGWPDVAVYGAIVTDKGDPFAFAGFMEVKTKTGRLSEAQRDVHDRLRSNGFHVATVRSVDDALATARAWGLPLRISA
jgi:hypothetical protein